MSRPDNSPPCIRLDVLLSLVDGHVSVDGRGRVLTSGGHLGGWDLALGIPPGDELGVLLEPVVDGRRLPRLLRAIRETAESREPRRLRAFPFRPQGLSACSADISLLPLEDQDGVALLLRDVTENVRTREQYERILNSTPDGIFVVDPDRRVRLFNAACGEITGREPQEILRRGCECSEVIHCHTEEGESFAQHLCPARAVFRGETTSEREEMLLTNSAGEERWIETTYSAVRNDRGEVEYVIGVLRDVHERKLLEERLGQSEKLASLGQLVAGIAHEIKNPLAVLFSALDVMGSQERSGREKAEAMDLMRAEIRGLEERLTQFLDFAKPRHLALRPMTLSRPLHLRTAAVEAVYPELEIQLEAGTPEPLIMGDEEQLQQVIMNLLLNAAEAMEGRGRVLIRTRAEGPYALIEVEDTGPGIPPEHLHKVFDPFFTTKPRGTGLGLSVSYQIVLAHRGTISIKPGPGNHGTRFTIRLPMATRLETSSPPLVQEPT